MTLDQLNALDQAGFVDQLGWTFEHSPWVAKRAWERRPFASLDALHAAMVAEVEHATHEEQLALLCAHPDLGARAKLSAASAGEQAGVGLNRMVPSDSKMLKSMNTAYRQKFGFPFLYAVKGSNPSDILLALVIRMEHDPEEEFHIALFEVFRIGRFRLEAIIS
jgi:2-oxo-4-hydroxy-4-carboxy-5-ureidoimidazoline decarboxylase